MIPASWTKIKLICFIIKVSNKTLPAVKEQLINVVSQLPEDDFAFLYHPDRELELLDSAAETAYIVGYKTPLDFFLEQSMKECIYLMRHTWPYAQKKLFIIVDRFNPKWDFDMEQAKLYNSSNDCGCDVILCGIGDKCKDMKINFEVNKIGEYINARTKDIQSKSS